LPISFITSFLHFTPGVKLDGNRFDDLKQSYRNPKHLVQNVGIDVLIVGRGIYASQDPIQEVKKYIYTKKDDALETIKLLGIVKKGQFTLKSGLKSDIYVDLRLLMSYSTAMKKTCKALCELGNLPELFEHCAIVGVPMGALPIASALSHETCMPMIMVRDKQKEYGCKNLIEGSVPTDKKVVVIEDVITTGGSAIQFIEKLEEQGLTIVQLLCVLDREQGGVESIREKGYDIKALFKLSEFK